MACGFDLRGSSSPRCPECGTARDWQPLLFLDLESFRRARFVLSEAGLLMKEHDPSSGQAGLFMFLMGFERAGQLWVSRDRLDEALERLDAAGVPASLPVADRGEPRCPLCGAATDPAGPQRCPRCGAQFEWIESSEEAAAEPEDEDRRVPRRFVVAAVSMLALAAVLAVANDFASPISTWISAVAVTLAVLGICVLSIRMR